MRAIKVTTARTATASSAAHPAAAPPTTACTTSVPAATTDAARTLIETFTRTGDVIDGPSSDRRYAQRTPAVAMLATARLTAAAASHPVASLEALDCAIRPPS
jgi:hypothetical protein